MDTPAVGEWTARLHRDPTGWFRREHRLLIFRRLPDGKGEQMTGWDDDGTPIVTPFNAGQELPGAGFRIPDEALPWLREEIEPGPSRAEVLRLEEALAVERARVDRFLAAEDRERSVRIEPASAVEEEAMAQRWLARVGVRRVLELAGNEWGRLGVAKLAAQLTDTDVLVRHLTEGPAPAVEEEPT